MPFKVNTINVNADWIDQGWGNKKARLWLYLYRNRAIVHKEDIWGIC